MFSCVSKAAASPARNAANPEPECRAQQQMRPQGEGEREGEGGGHMAGRCSDCESCRWAPGGRSCGGGAGGGPWTPPLSPKPSRPC